MNYKFLSLAIISATALFSGTTFAAWLWLSSYTETDVTFDVQSGAVMNFYQFVAENTTDWYFNNFVEKAISSGAILVDKYQADSKFQDIKKYRDIFSITSTWDGFTWLLANLESLSNLTSSDRVNSYEKVIDGIHYFNIVNNGADLNSPQSIGLMDWYTDDATPTIDVVNLYDKEFYVFQVKYWVFLSPDKTQILIVKDSYPVALDITLSRTNYLYRQLERGINNLVWSWIIDSDEYTTLAARYLSNFKSYSVSRQYEEYIEGMKSYDMAYLNKIHNDLQSLKDAGKIDELLFKSLYEGYYNEVMYDTADPVVVYEKAQNRIAKLAMLDTSTYYSLPFALEQAINKKMQNDNPTSPDAWATKFVVVVDQYLAMKLKSSDRQLLLAIKQYINNKRIMESN